MNRRKLIFVTNDDGYASAGFAAAVEVAQTLGDVIAVAPRTPQSGRSQAITLTEKLLLEKVRSDNGIEIYTLTGTEQYHPATGIKNCPSPTAKANFRLLNNRFLLMTRPYENDTIKASTESANDNNKISKKLILYPLKKQRRI